MYNDYEGHVVCYFNGLGRPLSLTPDFDSDRSWFRRAWTLQEAGATNDGIKFGGETGDDSISMTFREQLVSSQTLWYVEDALLQMQKQVSTNPTDRVAGLAYLLYTKYIPTYDAEQSEESAWVVLVDAMNAESQTRLLICYPEPGNGGKCWRASWEQVMNTPLLLLGDFECKNYVGRTDETDVDWYQGPCIDSANVRGLADTSVQEKPRRGELVFKDDAEEPHTFNILSDHQYSIPDGSYTLIGRERQEYTSTTISEMWVVGHQRPDGKFEKLSVVRVDGNLGKFSQSGVKMALC